VTTLTVGSLDARTDAYVRSVLDAIESHVPLVEAYLVGSGAAGGFDPQTSDVDLVVVTARELGGEREPLVDSVQRLEPPVRALELVVYVEGAQPPRFELNLSGGEERPDEEPFWFVLDAAVAEERAVPLLAGIPWTELFEPIPEERIREAAEQSLAWSAQRPDDDFARRHAARVRHHLAHGDWISKAEAGA
jgi:predicted nucleotidyltransferase